MFFGETPQGAVCFQPGATVRPLDSAALLVSEQLASWFRAPECTVEKLPAETLPPRRESWARFQKHGNRTLRTRVVKLCVPPGDVRRAERGNDHRTHTSPCQDENPTGSGPGAKRGSLPDAALAERVTSAAHRPWSQPNATLPRPRLRTMGWQQYACMLGLSRG
jgi:hypothetical protein